MNPSLMCASVACRRVRAEGSAYCDRHAHWTVLDGGAEYEAARIHDPERAAWDVWDDGGLERPGEDEL